jgi:hypothetical protein
MEISPTNDRSGMRHVKHEKLLIDLLRAWLGERFFVSLACADCINKYKTYPFVMFLSAHERL